MLRKLLTTLSIVAASAGLTFAQNEAAIKVTLKDKANKETIPFANVIVEMGGIQVGVGTTNIDGDVTIKPLNPGKYKVKATYVGYQTVEIADVSLAVGKTVYLNIEMSNAGGIELSAVELIVYSEPLIDPDTKSGSTVTREEYQNMASKNINSVAATTAGIYQADEGGALNVRGARSSSTAYYIDGVKVVGGAGVPQSSVEQVTTIIGGTPAEYGDATGGIIAITTRGPASNYTGGIEIISSGLGEKNQKSRGLDAYGYNFVGFSINGPILMKKDSVNNIKKSVLGFSLSGEMFTDKDPDPSAIGFYQVNAEKLSELEKSPLRPNPNGAGGFVPNSEFVTAGDLEKIKARNNVRANSFRLNGKIQYQPTTNMGITLGGSEDYNTSHGFVYEYALFNPVNNPQQISNTWRTYAKLTQKFNAATAEEAEKSSSAITNAYFTLQASYANASSKTQDDNHKDRNFDYGYIGKFVQTKENNYIYETRDNYDLDGDGILDTVSAFYHNGFRDVSLSFTPSDVNPTGVPYTSEFYANTTNPVFNLNSVQAGLGLMNGDRPSNIYSLWYNTGRQYGGYAKSEESQFRVFTNFSADIKKHAVQAGFEFEQRNQRSYNINSIDLWTNMRQLANSHITQLDSTPHLNSQLSGTNLYYDFDRLNDGTQTQFDRSLRTALGYDKNSTNWIDVDSYTPEQIESYGGVGMFSPDDLLNLGSVAYHGYDHTGKKLNGSTSLDDFFTKKDVNGNFTREIGAYQPIYIAGYIQDRFDFKDLKFNIGLRIDRFDANQKVLKDKFLLYEAKTAGEVNFASEFNTTRPANIGDDYVVYVDNKDNPTKTVGYRNGSTWYNAQGGEVSDPNASLAGANTVDGEINPYLLDPAAAKNKVLSSKVFEDYTPQINMMPRIAFSFPISDVANFFAHYDVLTQRPPTANRLDPIQYLNIQKNAGDFINNPNLKPERTTDYELGFSQVLNEKKNSAITLSAFYRELRDMVQVVQVYKAFPVTYNSFDNIDFGTVKGFSIAYDLRRTNGVQLTTNYTLQFADGTGSSATDGVNVASSGQPNLRTTHALDYDQRHTIVMNVDYRFASGTDYKGPIWTRKKGTDKEKSIKIFENVGANIVARAGSGTPYSRQRNITQEAAFGISQRSNLAGQVNGSNLPWNFKIDMRIDKDILLKWGDADGDKEKRANLNIYLQALNVLNTKNILSVYKATGNAGDDGYLTSADNINSLPGRNNAESFTDLYNVKVNDPSFYSRPRVLRLGLLLDF
ncbi:MAG: carboxypeptidase regulatory-like domain-containing protein [Bacteroidia bacterium]|nr:carboxypeptidase regulatory-like domain-containing protein [Bacteroidia bacterium]